MSRLMELHGRKCGRGSDSTLIVLVSGHQYVTIITPAGSPTVKKIKQELKNEKKIS